MSLLAWRVGGWTKTKLMLNSAQLEVVVEVEVELGNIKVIGPDEMPILVWGGTSAPQLKWDRPKTYKF